MLSFPCTWGGKLLKGSKDLAELTGYSQNKIISLTKQQSLEEIIIGSEANHKDKYYPQIVDGIYVRTDLEAAKVLNLSEDTIIKYRLRYVSLQEILDRRELKEKNSTRGKLYSCIKEQYKGTLDDFLKQYNKYNYPIKIIYSWFKRGCDYNRVIDKLNRFRYPIEYNNKVYNNDTDVSNDFNLPVYTVRDRRSKGLTFEELISQPYHPYTEIRRTQNAEKNGYPYISPNGDVAYNDREMAEICKKDIYWVRNKRQFGWSPEEMYLGDVGLPKADYSKSTTGNSRSFLLLNKYWYPSIKECLNRIGLASYSQMVRSTQDKDEGIARAFISFAIKNNRGYLTPSLKIDHLLHIHGDTAYYCCYLDGEVDYLSSKNILIHRMNYIQFNLESHIYRNNGVFNTLKYAEIFYCIGRGSIPRKAKKENTSYEEALKNIISSKRHQNPTNINGVLYSSVGVAAKKNNINKNTLHSRIKSSSGSDIDVSTSTTFTITVNKWYQGRAIGKETLSYKTKKELLLKMGIPVNTTYCNLSQGASFESLVNKELEKRNLYWCPFVKTGYSSISELCNIVGLSKDRIYAIWRKGKPQGLTFWETLQRYYMNTEESFDKYKDNFKCVFPHGTFYLKDIVIMGDSVYYHTITPSGMLKVMDFTGIFKILVESRC